MNEQEASRLFSDLGVNLLLPKIPIMSDILL